ncbi:MAG TPA: hypothetical protein DCP53_05450 [Elusimicrobia bacterium]|nr:hypothetical protein [Elusimicrobiota bacterium]
MKKTISRQKCDNTIKTKKMVINYGTNDIDTLKKLTLFMIELKDYKKAINLYDEILFQNPNDWKTWFGKAIVYLHMVNELYSLDIEDQICSYCEIIGIE